MYNIFLRVLVHKHFHDELVMEESYDRMQMTYSVIIESALENSDF